MDTLDEALNILMDREREAVVAALLSGFGFGDTGRVEGLFVSLWRSNDRHDNESIIPNVEDDLPEMEADILNDVSDEKLAGYEWIAQGCPSRGPIRSTAEMDD